MTPKKRRSKKNPLRGCSPDVQQLYRAIQNYVEVHGGKLIVVGGIQVQEWPNDGMGKFEIAVKCLGRKPVFHTLKELRK